MKHSNSLLEGWYYYEGVDHLVMWTINIDDGWEFRVACGLVIDSYFLTNVTPVYPKKMCETCKRISIVRQLGE